MNNCKKIVGWSGCSSLVAFLLVMGIIVLIMFKGN